MRVIANNLTFADSLSPIHYLVADELICVCSSPSAEVLGP